MKSLYIVSLFVLVAFFGTTFYFSNLAESLNWEQTRESINGNDFSPAFYKLKNLAELGVFVCIAFSSFFMIVSIFTLRYLRTGTAVIMSFTGLVASVVFCFISVRPYEDIGLLSFSEFLMIPAMYQAIMLPLFIINLYQAFRRQPRLANPEVLDDLQ